MMAARMACRLGLLTPSLLFVLLIVTSGVAADDSSDAWAALVKGGHVAVIRHGNAPPGYGGDPPGFRFDDCKTQRNLDDMGRAQARALGEAFRKHGVRVDRILSSPVCRCRETGELMAIGSVETSWALLPDTGPGAGQVPGVEGDRLLVARTGHAGAGDSRADRQAADRVPAGTSRDGRAPTGAREPTRRECCGKDRAASIGTARHYRFRPSSTSSASS